MGETLPEVATGSTDRRLRIISDRGVIEREVVHENTVVCCAWSQDGSKVATGSVDKHLRIIDAATGVILHALEHENSVVTPSSATTPF